MATTKAKNDNLKRFEKDLWECTKCGYCTFWCPVYQEQPVESSVARGKNEMIRDVLAGKTDFNKEYVDRLSKCLLCRTCTEHCPAKAETPPFIVAARADLVKAKGIHFPYNFVYRSLLPRRQLFGNVVKTASKFQGIFLPRTEGTIRHLSMFMSALGEGRQIPEIASKFLRQQVPEVNKPPAGVATKMRVGYFSGCMTDFVFPHTGKKVINVLNKNGVEVVMPFKQGCCGAPVFLGAGDLETGRKFADTNVKVFADFDIVITNCGTCASALKDYVKLLADTPERVEAYTKFVNKVQDISQFLVDRLQVPASSFKAAAAVKGKKVTYHDSCHLNRYLNIHDQPRQILKSIDGIEYVEMPMADWCCGMAGTFSLKYYDLSKKIADKKMQHIKESGADIVAAGCPGCMIQLIDNTVRHKMPQKVMHVMDLIE